MARAKSRLRIAPVPSPASLETWNCTFLPRLRPLLPHENVGILARVPRLDLWHDEPRSGGRFGKRLTWPSGFDSGLWALPNAAGNGRDPVVAAHDRGPAPRAAVAAADNHVLYVVALFMLPVWQSAAQPSESQTGSDDRNVDDVATRLFYALIPLGFECGFRITVFTC